MRIMTGIAWLGVMLTLAACSTAPEKNTNTVYFDPDSGEYSVGENASDDTRELAALLGMAADLNQPQDLSDEEIWRSDADGNLTHIQSGLICPVTWGGYIRTNETIYNRNGEDVSCNYGDGNSTVVTYYAYRTAMSVEDELVGIMEQVVKARHPVYAEAAILNASASSNGFHYVGDAISYSDANGQEMKSGLVLADATGWRLKVRITYPLENAEKLEAFVGASLLGQWDGVRETQLSRPAETASPNEDTI